MYIKFFKTFNASDAFLFPKLSVKSNITAMLSSYFEVGNYDYGKECSITDLEKMISENNDGVKSVRLSVRSSISSGGDLIIKPALSQILTLGSITFNLSGGVE